MLVFSVAFESYRRTEAAIANVESAVLKVPSKITRGSFILVRKIGVGVVGAVHVLIVLVSVMLLAGFLGVGLVQLWTEEPVLLRQRLFFDYTDVNPKAVFMFGGDVGSIIKKRQIGVPIGHTFHVNLQLLMPDSDYNRQVGMFQLTAEILSSNENVVSKSSRPCMLPFRSLPIRLLQTCLMSIPLVLGISAETQKISVEILKHKEGYPRTKAIRVTLIPRAGTSYLPQLYEAEILMNSRLPWTKQLVRNWKWTISIWATLYIYIMLVIILICCCRPLLFPLTIQNFSDHDGIDKNSSTKENIESGKGLKDEREVSELLRKWQQRRRKRRANFLQKDTAETEGSSASSISVNRKDTSVVVEEDIGESESVF
ncbi:hypothetical protein GH714_016982 [Hevea brasiliensis]|uniref:Seipin 1A n=1 Tax=Hevea brasiliensis TaxID=3981 RepID=A0A6A6KE83_HEVBR|nr:hypothetical protein GH714_016982 [Hevea brasiliensis]